MYGVNPADYRHPSWQREKLRPLPSGTWRCSQHCFCCWRTSLINEIAFLNCVLTTGKRNICGFHFSDCLPMSRYYRLASSVSSFAWLKWTTMSTNLTRGFRKAAEQQAAAVVFPELCITGYSCGDLSSSRTWRKQPWNGLLRFTEATEFRHDCRGGPALPS